MNLRVRMKNPIFWAQIAVAVISPILVGLGLQWQNMTSWGTLFEAILKALENPIIVVAIVGSVWTALTDPTTQGLGDTIQVLSYDKPKK